MKVVARLAVNAWIDLQGGKKKKEEKKKNREGDLALPASAKS